MLTPWATPPSKDPSLLHQLDRIKSELTADVDHIARTGKRREKSYGFAIVRGRSVKGFEPEGPPPPGMPKDSGYYVRGVS